MDKQNVVYPFNGLLFGHKQVNKVLIQATAEMKLETLYHTKEADHMSTCDRERVGGGSNGEILPMGYEMPSIETVVTAAQPFKCTENHFTVSIKRMNFVACKSQ